MKFSFQKRFHFSASFERDGKIHAHNYVLEIVTDPVDEASELILEKKVRNCLIAKLDSHDLGLHVDFLKNADLTEANLLSAFRKLLSKEILPLKLISLSLERDKNTRVNLHL